MRYDRVLQLLLLVLSSSVYAGLGNWLERRAFRRPPENQQTLENHTPQIVEKKRLEPHSPERLECLASDAVVQCLSRKDVKKVAMVLLTMPQIIAGPLAIGLLQSEGRSSLGPLKKVRLSTYLIAQERAWSYEYRKMFAESIRRKACQHGNQKYKEGYSRGKLDHQYSLVCTGELARSTKGTDWAYR